MEEAALCQCGVFGSRSWYEYLTMNGSGLLDWLWIRANLAFRSPCPDGPVPGGTRRASGGLARDTSECPLCIRWLLTTWWELQLGRA